VNLVTIGTSLGNIKVLALQTSESFMQIFTSGVMVAMWSVIRIAIETLTHIGRVSLKTCWTRRADGLATVIAQA